MVVTYTYSKADRWVLVAASDQPGGEGKDIVNLPYNTGIKVHFKTTVTPSVADSDPGSGAFLTPGSGMGKNQDPDPG
jgi:hypothetical protein